MMSGNDSNKTRRRFLKSGVVGTGVLSTSGLAAARRDRSHSGSRKNKRIKRKVEKKSDREWVWADELKPETIETYSLEETSTKEVEIFEHSGYVFSAEIESDSGRISIKKIGESNSIDAQSLAKEGQVTAQVDAPDIVVDSGPICPEPECDNTGLIQETPTHCENCCSACESWVDHHYTGFWFELNKYADAAGKTVLSAVLAYGFAKFVAGTAVSKYLSVKEITAATGTIVDFMMNLASSKTYTVSVEDIDVYGQPIQGVSVALEKRAKPDDTMTSPVALPGHFYGC